MISIKRQVTVLPPVPYRKDLTIMHVLQKGVKLEDHPPPHTVPHYYFLFLSGDYKSPLTQCIPQSLLSRRREQVIIWLDVNPY